jgi:hypothetical protein
MLREHHAAFDRRAGVARIAHGQLYAVRSRGKGGVGIAVAEAAVADDVGANRRMQQRRILRERVLDRHRDRQRFVVHLDQVERVLGQRAVLGRHHRHGLPGVAHPVHRQRPVLHGLLDAHHEGRSPGSHVLASEHCAHSGGAQRGADVDRADRGVRVRGPQHRRVQGAGLCPEVVGEAPAAGEQRLVLQPLDGPAHMAALRAEPRFLHVLRPPPLTVRAIIAVFSPAAGGRGGRFAAAPASG